MKASSSIIHMKLGKSLSRMLGIPGIPSIVVSRKPLAISRLSADYSKRSTKIHIQGRERERVGVQTDGIVLIPSSGSLSMFSVLFWFSVFCRRRRRSYVLEVTGFLD